MRAKPRPSSLAFLTGLSLALVTGCTSSSNGAKLEAPPVAAAAKVAANATGLTASVPAQAGDTYAWTITGGTITGGEATSAITFTAGASGSIQLSCTMTAKSGFATTSSTTLTVTGLSLFAGNISGVGSTDGTGAAGRFQNPCGMALDPASGNLYVADSSNNTIRMVTPAGLVSTVAGVAGQAGHADTAPGIPATFNGPLDVAVDGAGNLFVADYANDAIRKITLAHGVATVSTVAGQVGGASDQDGTGDAASFQEPASLVMDHLGDLYVNDAGGLRLLTFNAQGAATVTTMTLSGTAQATFGAGSLAVDASNNLYISSLAEKIAKITIPAPGTASGAWGTSWGSGGSGGADGPGATARFSNPQGLAVTVSGTLYVADSDNDTIRMINLATNTVSTVAGVSGGIGSADGQGGSARLNGPQGLALDAAGDLYVSDYFNNTIRKLTFTAGVATTTTLAGAPLCQGGADGTGAAAEFCYPRGLAVDGSGNAYVADLGNNAIRRITPAGAVDTIFGLEYLSKWGWCPNVAVDGSGTVYGNVDDQAMVFKLAPDGQADVLAGNLNNPCGMAVAADGTVYWADSQDDVIYRLSPAGVVSVLAGTVQTPGSTDSASGAPLFNAPNGLALDAAGALYVADSGNNTIRKITLTPAVTVTTLTGTAGVTGSADGAGPAASFNDPLNLAVDASGNLFVTDYQNNTVRKVSPTGVVSTLAGAAGSMGTTPGALPASLAQPYGIAVDPTTGAVLITVPDAVLKLVY